LNCENVNILQSYVHILEIHHSTVLSPGKDTEEIGKKVAQTLWGPGVLEPTFQKNSMQKCQLADVQAFVGCLPGSNEDHVSVDEIVSILSTNQTWDEREIQNNEHNDGLNRNRRQLRPGRQRVREADFNCNY
jgi:hypothetical protein